MLLSPNLGALHKETRVKCPTRRVTNTDIHTDQFHSVIQPKRGTGPEGFHQCLGGRVSPATITRRVHRVKVGLGSWMLGIFLVLPWCAQLHAFPGLVLSDVTDY